MRQSLRYASWLLLLFILLSCSHRVTGEATALPPILQAEAQSQKYNLQLDFMKHHFSGMLIVRQMPDNEIRILGSTYFGLSLFDFSLHCDTFIVNSCMQKSDSTIANTATHLLPILQRNFLTPKHHDEISHRQFQSDHRRNVQTKPHWSMTS